MNWWNVVQVAMKMGREEKRKYAVVGYRAFGAGGWHWYPVVSGGVAHREHVRHVINAQRAGSK